MRTQDSPETVNDFDSIADVYDELVAWAPYDEWVASLIERMQRYGLPRGGTVLDAACGTGLSSIPFGRRGYRVTGVDRCEEMLAQARQKAEEAALDAAFVCADLLDMDVETRFDAAVCMHSGLDYFLDLNDLSCVFRSLRRHLKPGGLFAFDKCLDEPEFYRAAYTDSRTLSCGTVTFRYSWDKKRKLFDQRCVVMRNGPDGRVRRSEVLHRMRAVEVGELVEMVESAGFRVLEPPVVFTILDPGMGIFRAE